MRMGFEIGRYSREGIIALHSLQASGCPQFFLIQW